jgi:hypothetical protein
MNAAAEEALRLALNLGRNCGYHVFPCGDDKRPMILGWPERASADPEAIWQLWHKRPGSLIGVATGAPSGVSVLDIDQKHPEGVAWWQYNRHRLLPTLTVGTRSGGLHLWFRHQESVRNTQAKIALGVDTRGDGGYVIHWFAAGLPCLDQSPPAPWPSWLLTQLARQPAPQPQLYGSNRSRNDSAALDGILRRVGNAREGERNGLVFWAACKLRERNMQQSDVEGLLLPVAISIGLDAVEARRSIASAMRRAVA